MEPPSCIIDEYVSGWIALILVLIFYTTFSSSKIKLLYFQSEVQFPFGVLDSFIAFLKTVIVIIITSNTWLILKSDISVWIILIISVLISAIVLRLFGSYVPKSIDKYFPHTNSVFTNFTRSILAPFNNLYIKIMDKYAKEIDENNNESEEQVLNEITEPEQKELIKGVISFSTTQVQDIMTKREDIAGIEYSFSSGEMVKTAIESGFSRLPVYRNTIDNIVGFLYIKDLLSFLKDTKYITDWHSFIRGAHFTHSTKLISELLDELRENKIHLAIVLDDKEKCLGLITLEDIVEEIVGEISDETDNSL